MEAKELLETIAKMSDEEREKVSNLLLGDICVITEAMPVKYKKLTATAKKPTRAHASDAGLDLYVDERLAGEKACYQGNDPNFGAYYYYKPYIKYRSNIAMEIPKGYVGLLFPRSSVYKKALQLSNSVGVIDSGYRGSIDAVYWTEHQDINEDGEVYSVGDRFAQLIIIPYPSIELVETDELSSSDRGTGGYGSTGK